MKYFLINKILRINICHATDKWVRSRSTPIVIFFVIFFFLFNKIGRAQAPIDPTSIVSKVTRQINQLDVASTTVTVPFSLGPMCSRTSLEAKYDPQPNWHTTTDPALVNIKQYGLTTGTPTCDTISANPHIGKYALKIIGHDNSAATSSVYFKVFSVNIPVTGTTEMSFWTYPLNALGSFISVDLDLTDGMHLRSTAAVDYTGVSMKPSTGRGTVNTWTKTTGGIGLWLNGKTISKITVGYDNNSSTGDFSGYVDDIDFYDQSYSLLPVTISSFTAIPAYNDIAVQWSTSSENSVDRYDVERSFDGVHFNFAGSVSPASLNIQGVNNYGFTDLNAVVNFESIGHLYYRIKTTGAEGGVVYSMIQPVSFPRKNTFVTNLYPNPFTNTINITMNSTADSYLEAVVSGVGGNVLLRTKIKVAKGISNVAMAHLEGLHTGIYFLKLSRGNEMITYKIEK